MAAVATDIVTRIAELSDSAYTAFCEDIAGMFGVEMQCERRQVQSTAARNVREHFKKLTAVHVTKADGALKGTFQLVFDQGGLFILSGVIVMLPESRIIEDAKRGSIEDANNLQDAAREVGNLLVGSWDRVFREDCPGHEHFVKASTFIGKAWEKLDQIELSADAEVVEVLYEMTIDSYPSFSCAAIFATEVLRGLGETEPSEEQENPDEAAPPEGNDKAKVTPAKPAPAPSPKPALAPAATPSPKPSEPVAEAKPVVEAVSSPPPAETPVEPEPAEPSTSVPPQPAQEPSPAAVEEHPPQAPPEGVAQAPQGSPSSAPEPSKPSRGLIPPTPRSPSIDAGMLPSELASAESGGAARRPSLSFLDTAYIQSRPDAGLTEFLSTPVAEIMEKEVIWAGPEDTVQAVIAKMQQHNVGYVVIGANGVLEGLVSGSNILGAVSLYLRPMFAKWRRPQDDATLEVKVKWVMSRPVRTVRPDATLAATIESMRRCGGRCLPVVDAKGTVQGMVTVFDILLRLLESDKSVSWQGRPPQAPPLLL